jgi:hypothetical protein
MSDKIEKIKADLVKYKAELEKYQKLFLADGEISAEEQKQLDDILGIIKKCEDKIKESPSSEVAGALNVESKLTDKEFSAILDQMEEIVNRYKQVYAVWSGRLDGRTNIA